MLDDVEGVWVPEVTSSSKSCSAPDFASSAVAEFAVEMFDYACSLGIPPLLYPHHPSYLSVFRLLNLEVLGVAPCAVHVLVEVQAYPMADTVSVQLLCMFTPSMNEHEINKFESLDYRVGIFLSEKL